MVDGEREPPRRLWVVFFSNADGPYWWSRLLRPGYRHVEAASWFPDQQRWVHVRPTAKGLRIDLYGRDEFDGRLGQLAEDSTLILRMPANPEGPAMPGLTWFCVGTIKALLGVRSRALLPWGLAKYLLRIGAEVVENPGSASPEAAQGRPEGESPARAGACAV